MSSRTRGVPDIEAFTAYIELMSPLTTTVSGKIKYI